LTGGWRKLHNEELRDLCSVPSAIGMIKPSRMRWEGRVARMVEKRNAYRYSKTRRKETIRETEIYVGG
jgi:hypothetical protein